MAAAADIDIEWSQLLTRSEIDLSFVKFNQESVDELVNLLLRHQDVTYLDLTNTEDNNSVFESDSQSEGAAWCGLVPAFANVLPQLLGLRASKTSLVPPLAAAWRSLCARPIFFPALAYVNLQNNRLGPADAVWLASMLGKASNLRELLLDRNQLGDEGVETLLQAATPHPSLTTLHLGGNEAGPAGLAGLPELLVQNTRLEVLHLRPHEPFPDEEDVLQIIEALDLHPTLSRLMLHLDHNNRFFHDFQDIFERNRLNNVQRKATLFGRMMFALRAILPDLLSNLESPAGVR